MPGAGTRAATTKSSELARCLDLTRLLSRVGRGPLTGVDRVEYAYLDRLAEDPAPIFGLVRTSLGFVLLDRRGLHRFRDVVGGRAAWAEAPWYAPRLSRLPPERLRAERTLRDHAVDRCMARGLGRMLRRSLPPDVRYLNVGHTNLNPKVLDAVRSVQGSSVAVMLHDTIPADFPEFQRKGAPERFSSMLSSMAKYADLVIYNSAVSMTDGERHFATMGRVPKGVVSHLGVERLVPRAEAFPRQLDPSVPYFVILGTIEPRKNHALLLDIWDSFAREDEDRGIPALVIAGNRGWNNEAVFRRLDAAETKGKRIIEISNLGDGAIGALLQRCAGLLQPSFAEGYGLPPAEAALLGAPLLCNDLPVTREILGDIPVYASVTDMYLWKKCIRQMSERHPKPRDTSLSKDLPTWDDHFKKVLALT